MQSFFFCVCYAKYYFWKSTDPKNQIILFLFCWPTKSFAVLPVDKKINLVSRNSTLYCLKDNAYIWMLMPMPMSTFPNDLPKILLFGHCHWSLHWELLSNIALRIRKDSNSKLLRIWTKSLKKYQGRNSLFLFIGIFKDICIFSRACQDECSSYYVSVWNNCYTL